MTQSRRIIRRIAKWLGVVLCLSTLAAWAWVLVTQRCLLCLLPGHVGFSIAPYCLSFGFARAPMSAPLFEVIDASGWWPKNLPTFRRFPGNEISVGIPFWLLTPIFLAATLWLWRKSRGIIPPGHCRKCGYNLSGNVSGICPECGSAAMPAGGTG